MLDDLPSPDEAYAYENAFYLTCSPARIGKLVAHIDLYRQASHVPGAIVECGVFKGASFARLAVARHLFESEGTRPLVGFDTFGTFPATAFEPDRDPRQRFIASAGAESISVEQLRGVLAHKGCGAHVTLIEGDICETVPAYVAAHPELRIALLHVDVDIFEPTDTVMTRLAPLVVPGGIIVLDDYGIFPGATRAIDAWLAGRPEQLQKLPYALAPSYVVCARPEAVGA